MRDQDRLWRSADIAGGAVCLHGTGILVEHLASRYAAGEPLGALAADYDVTVQDIEAALRAVLRAAFGRRGLRAEVRRALEAAIPLQPARSSSVYLPADVSESLWAALHKGSR